MNILVTGGSGRIGRYVVRELVQAGHEVTSVDVMPATFPGARSLQVDLTDAGQVYGALALAQAQAVVHLAAWARDGMVPDTRTYGDNVRETFHLFQACADLGIRRVISASSHHVYGVVQAPPLYVPIDEDHPWRPASAYGLSKAAGEQAAAYFVAQHGLEILSFRFGGVRPPAELDGEIAEIVAHPERALRLLWTRCDARDAALACRLAVEAAQVTPGPYNVTGPRIVPDEETASLVARFFPQTEIRAGLEGHAAPLSSARARAAFGYQPRYVWSASQRYPEEDAP